LTRNLGDVHLEETGNINYDNIQTYIRDVLTPYSVVINLPYSSSNLRKGKLVARGWDLIIEGKQPVKDRDFYFIGGNINNTYINGVYNLSFIGTRLKHRIWLVGKNNAYISFIRHAATGTPVQKDIPVSGPSSNKGWVEIKASQGNRAKSDWKSGNEALIIQAPKNDSKVNSSQTVNEFNSIEVGVNGIRINNSLLEYTFGLDNNKSISILPPAKLNSSNDGYIDGGYLSLIAFNREGKVDLSKSASCIEYCVRAKALHTKKVNGGKYVSCTLGILKGNTGKENCINFSVYNGKIFIENRTQKLFFLKMKFIN